jgi:cytochrome c
MRSCDGEDLQYNTTVIYHRIHEEPRMKNLFITLISLTCATLPGVTWADLALATSKNCMACHALEKRIVGPAYKDVAAKYAGDKTAVDRLATKIQKGGGGVWGPMPMPANTQVNDAEAKKLAAWVLTVK